MNQQKNQNKLLTGIALAALAALIWSGNFIVARGVFKEIPPISLAFYRWGLATIMIAPFAWKKFKQELPIFKKSVPYFFWISLAGITLFNTFVYIAGHYSPAINLALIGTSSSPVIAIILSRIFLKEAVTPLRILGLILCIVGVLLLLSKGSWSNLLSFQFSRGDWWILAAATCFAIYSTLVKSKPAGISAINFLFLIFGIGTLLLLPMYIWEINHSLPVAWNNNLYAVIFYLSLGTSVLAYLCWNAAIGILGPSRTSLFSNLIPIFSSIEAVWILGEKITAIHLISGVIVITGLVLANLRKRTIPST